MSHISFSELKLWSECPFKRKLVYGDKIKGFEGNIYTAFGRAIHAACEKYILSKDLPASEDSFMKNYVSELGQLPENIQNELNQETAESFMEQGMAIIKEVPQALEDTFGDFQVVSAEEQLYEPIKEFVEKEYSFKGFIDLVLKTSDGKYHVIDWKSCSWGWDARRRQDSMNVYQLVFYKHYYSKKHGININDIDVHFGLLKRTAKEGAKVEIFKTTSGAIRTKNAIKLLNNALYNISKDRHIKNKVSCAKCEFYKTSHCP